MPDSTTFAAWFHPAATGRRLCVSWRPKGREPHTSLLLVPPFGEEMNKSRRTLALSARRFALAGYAVLFVDLYGTGDSDGEFADATWDTWIDDLQRAHEWMRKEWQTPVRLWALRTGALLAAELARNVHAGSLLLWQPVISGDTFLTQLLRMKIAADNFSTGATTSTRELKAQLAEGKSVEVGGYMLNPQLVLPMAEESLTQSAAPAHEVLWLETGAAEQSEPSVPAQKTIAAWQAQGAEVTARYVQGEPFWMTNEITENTALAEHSLRPLEVVSP